VILQPHCPELPSAEWRGLPEFAWVKEAEQFAFERCDVCVLPNQHALPIYSSLIREGLRIEYLMSGCRARKPRFLIPTNPAFTFFMYIGRRLAIKGFDLVLEGFSKAYESNKSIRLLVLGGGDPVQCPGVIDVGFSSDPLSWVNSCDYLVNANRDSYFDLSLMEALGCGTPLVVACTGGHKYFLEKESAGITTLEAPTVDGIEAAMLTHVTKRNDNAAASNANCQLYNEEFSVEKYHARLITLVRELTTDTAR
jgi:glycosyltransferase involved in cell wall biosynthesis